jgi:TonB-dependent SusC/RagA subfamily outer membrane receptor
MPSFLLYLLKLSISLSIVWIFYQLFLRRLTFYRMNRWYLLGYSLLSIFIPLINIGPILWDGSSGEPVVIQYIPTIGSVQSFPLPREVHSGGINGWNLLALILVLGALLLLVRSVMRWVSLLRLRQQARPIDGEGIKIYQVDASIIPFSFGNAIYINQHLHTEKEWSDIILHEYVHIRQKHTLDILLAEVFCMLNWYNPFCWLIRHSIRQNLEFIADSQVLENGVDKKGYQYHLLKVIGESRYRLANNFNFSSLKKRIIMMNKIRSARLHLLRFLFILPLVAVLLVAFRDRYSDLWRPSSGEVHVNVAGVVIDMVSKAPVAGVAVRDKVSGLQAMTDERGFYKFPVPVRADSIRIDLVFNKSGYDSSRSGSFFPSVKETRGVINVMAMENRSNRMKGFYMSVPYSFKCPVDPTYADVLPALQQQTNWNADFSRISEMEKEHPEVSLFYTAEGGHRQVVILTNGAVEKYGYPAGPNVADMEKKYGTLPGYMTSPVHPVNAGYLSRWEAVAAQAEKTFRTTSADVRGFVFPGDSRVIAIPLAGKPVVYDMDNGAARERAAFEKLYGPLPEGVPAAGFNSDMREGGLTAPATAPAVEARVAGAPAGPALAPRKGVGAKDTVPGAPRPVKVTIVSRDSSFGKALYVVDGIQRPDFKKDSITNPTEIARIDVLKGEEALRFYGEKGANGVIVITTKAFVQKHSPIRTVVVCPPHTDNSPTGAPSTSDGLPESPLFVVDGQIITKERFDKLNPDDIESVNVLKGKEATAIYGDKARNGVILLTMKKKTSRVQPVMKVQTVDGVMTVQVDTNSTTGN